MNKIFNRQDFESALQQSQLVLFVHSEWSKCSLTSKCYVDRLEKQIGENVAIFQINPDECDFILDWMSEQERENWETTGVMEHHAFNYKDRMRGFGEVAWIEDGEVKSFEPFAGTLRMRGLLQRTNKFFMGNLASA